MVNREFIHVPGGLCWRDGDEVIYCYPLGDRELQTLLTTEEDDLDTTLKNLGYVQQPNGTWIKCPTLDKT